MSPWISCGLNALDDALVLRARPGKSARFSRPVKDLRPGLVLPGREQDSTQVAQKIRADHSEGLLRDVPRQSRQRRGKRQRIYGDAGFVGDPATLKTVGGEIVRIAAAPLGLGVRPPGHLARRCRAGSLTNPDVWVGDEPAATDTARSFPAHPPMLPAPPSASSGPFLASRPGSILASAEVS